MSAVQSIARYISGSFGSLAGGRNRRLAVGAGTGVLVKAVTFGLTLVMVPITLNYLGQERYGIWVTLISLLAWLSTFDLGIANGLTPTLSRAFGKGRPGLARSYVATALWGLTIVALFAALLSWVLWVNLDWAYVFNVGDPVLATEIARAVATAGALFLACLPFGVNQRILLAYQEGKAANVANLVVSAASLGGLYVVILLNGGMVALVVGYFGMQLLASLAISIWLFSIYKPELNPFVLPNWLAAKKVLSVGGLLFVCQLATLVFFQKDTILITHYLGAREAATYSLVWQLFLYLNVTGILLSPYISPGFGEAVASGDYAWAKRTFLRYLAVSCALTIPAAMILAILIRQVLYLWTGERIVPATPLVVWMAMWTCVLAIANPVIAVLVGTGKVKRYAVLSTAAAVASLLISIATIRRFGSAGPIAATCMCYALIVLLPGLQDARRALTETIKF